jgi:hypothetical protein
MTAICASGATPKKSLPLFPAAIPATWVPCVSPKVLTSYSLTSAIVSSST